MAANIFYPSLQSTGPTTTRTTPHWAETTEKALSLAVSESQRRPPIPPLPPRPVPQVCVCSCIKIYAKFFQGLDFIFINIVLKTNCFLMVLRIKRCSAEKSSSINFHLNGPSNFIS